jgi:hypothetical protein
MTDIVERLREGVFGGDETKTDAVIHSHMQAGADEIERLRAERDAAVKVRYEAIQQMKAAKAEREEAVAALALYRMEHGCTRGQTTTQWCGEASRLRRAWLRLIQRENHCPATGGGCFAEPCSCLGEMEKLVEENCA